MLVTRKEMLELIEDATSYMIEIAGLGGPISETRAEGMERLAKHENNMYRLKAMQVAVEMGQGLSITGAASVVKADRIVQLQHPELIDTIQRAELRQFDGCNDIILRMATELLSMRRHLARVPGGTGGAKSGKKAMENARQRSPWALLDKLKAHDVKVEERHGI